MISFGRPKARLVKRLRWLEILRRVVLWTFRRNLLPPSSGLKSDSQNAVTSADDGHLLLDGYLCYDSMLTENASFVSKYTPCLKHFFPS